MATEADRKMLAERLNKSLALIDELRQQGSITGIYADLMKTLDRESTKPRLPWLPPGEA